MYSQYDSTPTERAVAKENLGWGWNPWENLTGSDAREIALEKRFIISRWLRRRMVPIL
jgi:hypothetical protein